MDWYRIMQSLNILMTIVQIFMAVNVVNRITHIKNFEECTESELNRVTVKIMTGILVCGFCVLASLLACLVVYKFNSGYGLIGQALLTAGIVFVWVVKIKEITVFEILLLKRRVERVGKERAVSRLYKKPSETMV